MQFGLCCKLVYGVKWECRNYLIVLQSLYFDRIAIKCLRILCILGLLGNDYQFIALNFLRIVQFCCLLHQFTRSAYLYRPISVYNIVRKLLAFNSFQLCSERK